MRILLVRPPVPKHTIGLKHIMICEPLELEYIAAAIPPEHKVMIFDHLVETGFQKRLESFNPEMMVTSCYKSGTNEVIKLCRDVKRWKPSCVTVAGGVHATLVPKDYADASIDIIGKGDGTFMLPEIIDALTSGSSIYQVSGLAIPKADGQVDLTPERQYMPKADMLPLPRRELVSHLQHKYYYLMHQPVATMKTTWGCWYRCNFCFTWKITDGSTYSRSPESIIAELQSIKADDVYIVDDIFLIKNSRLTKLAELIRANNIRKKYLVYARADFIAANEDVIAEWAELGLSAVFIGLEAVTDTELTSMNKELPAVDNIKAIEVLRKYNIDTYGSLIPGADYSVEDWDRLWTFIKDNGLYYVNISPHTPLPGADMWEEFKDQITVPEDAHGLFDLSHMILPTKMPLKQYYRQLLKLYARTILNLARAQKVAQRTLPSIWSMKYVRVILGSLKIGRQFWTAHKHHSPKEIAIATYKGEPVDGLTYKSKLSHNSFRKRPQYIPLPVFSDPVHQH